MNQEELDRLAKMELEIKALQQEVADVKDKSTRRLSYLDSLATLPEVIRVVNNIVHSLNRDR